MGNDSPAPNNLLEAVPNFSEGRSQPTLRRLVEAAGPPLLDLHADASHHRSVLTLAGSASQLRSSARSLFETAVRRIDLRRHRGEHPRIGALDVLPIVPLGGTTMDRAVRLAISLAEEIGSDHSVPVFLYGEAEPGRRTLPQIRRGGLRGLADRLARGEIRSDYGPPSLHPSAGGIAVGARRPLIAFNVNLETSDAGIARAIAGRIRTSAGGLPALRALGVQQADPASRRVLAQVSMNLLDWRRTSLADAFRRVLAEAGAAGTGVVHSEIVGLVPRAATWPGMEMEIALREPARTIEGVYQSVVKPT
ncbi:MAG: glutamate formimidoyltransferase [Acidobacteria bacterium]|nr:glutamate formimidoyltransferase [Acidobacteriota bacterium]